MEYIGWNISKCEHETENQKIQNIFDYKALEHRKISEQKHNTYLLKFLKFYDFMFNTILLNCNKKY